MPEWHFCQAFCAFFCEGLSNKQSMTYEIFTSKYFKNRAKKIELSLNFPTTRYSGTVKGQILPVIRLKNRRFCGKRPLEK